jgi:nitroimidazol reductase NimA-like FMN-containing flavoprotein (pyridoxamine 5'-phosphate oxidase superfamily)
MPVDDSVEVMTRDDCAAFLSSGSAGRVAVVTDAGLDVLPVSFRSDGRTIVIRAAPGSSLSRLSPEDAIVFEIDGYTDEGAWSVVARGRAHQLQAPSRGPAVEDALVGIRVDAITGRRLDLRPVHRSLEGGVPWRR